MTALNNLPQLIQPLLDAAATHANDFVPLGNDFLAVALILSALELVYEYFFVGGAQQFIAKAVRLFMVTSVPLLVLMSWSLYSSSLVGFCQHEIPSALGFSGTGLTALSDSINTLSNSLNGVVTASFMDAAKGGTSDHWLPSLDFTKVIYSAIAFLMLFIPAAILGFALLISLFYPLILMSVGTVFGPLLIAWLPFRPLSGLATNWLKFQLSAGFSFAVGLLLVSMASTMMNTFASEVKILGVQNLTDYVGAMGGLYIMAICMLLLAYIMLKSEHIGTALIGGVFAGGGGGLLAGMMLSKMINTKPNSPPPPDAPHPPRPTPPTPRPDAPEDGGKSQNGGQKQAEMSAGAAKASSAAGKQK